MCITKLSIRTKKHVYILQNHWDLYKIPIGLLVGSALPDNPLISV